MFTVEGGVYTDFSWTKIEHGTEEKFGPFATYAEARVAWESRARFMVDTACHRLVIKPVA